MANARRAVVEWFAIADADASAPDVDAVPHADEPVRPLPSPRPRPRVAGPWRRIADGYVRRVDRRVVAQVIAFQRPSWRSLWVVSGVSGESVLMSDGLDSCDRILRKRGWVLS